MKNYEWQKELRRSGLPPSTRLVGFALSTYCDTEGETFVGHSTLGAACGLSRRRIIDHIKRLEADRWIIVDRGIGKAARVKTQRFYKLSVPDDWVQESPAQDDDDKPEPPTVPAAEPVCLKPSAKTTPKGHGYIAKCFGGCNWTSGEPTTLDIAEAEAEAHNQRRVA